jgi:NADPH:quinone reductase-like Zn-dependent oxidoreductase
VSIQLAKHLGAYVATSCSEKNLDLVKSLGADEAIDYRARRVEDVVKDYDVAVDAVTSEGREKTLRMLRNGGFLVMLNSGIPENVKAHGPVLGLLAAVSSSAWFTISSLVTRFVRVSHVLRRSDGDLLQRITELVESGAIRPLVDSVHPLEEISKAHALSESGRARGKIVIRLRSGTNP